MVAEARSFPSAEVAARPVVAARSTWIRGPVWDLALLSFGWLPFCLYFVFGLHLGTGGAGIMRRPEFATAILIVLGLIFAHRHYVFLMVYGDRTAFQARPRSFVLAAVAIVGVTALAWFFRAPLPGVWTAVVTVGVVWNIWHSIMQRYGIGRIYAGRAGGGLEAAAHGSRDKRLLWSGVLLVSVGILVTRTDTLGGHPSTKAILRTLKPLLGGVFAWTALAITAAAFVTAFVLWARAEFGVALAWRERLPRLAFVGSTLLLLGILYVYGPIVGFLVFASAHAVEYIAFVHHFAARSYANRDDRFVARVLKYPLRSAILIVPLSFGFYAWLRESGFTLLGVFVIYEVSAAMVHFVYDGWVWKARSPAVRKPLQLA